MFFFFLCGEHTFRSEVEGYEGIMTQCHHCGNMSARVLKSRPFFTLCFVPIIPFTISGYKDVACHICNFHQALESRPDVVAMKNGGGGGGGGGGPHHQGQPPQQWHGQQQQWQGQGGHQQQQQYQAQPQPHSAEWVTAIVILIVVTTAFVQAHAASPHPASATEDYQLVYAQLYESTIPHRQSMTGDDSQQQQQQQQHRHHMSTTQLSSPPPAELFLPASLTRRPTFTPEEQTYLRNRLPLQEPATPQTVARHFRRLPLLYQDLAAAYRARLLDNNGDELGAAGEEDWARRERMAELAEGLAKKYHAFRLVLPRSYARDTMVKWRRSEVRASRFWDKVLDEVEKANRSWSIVRLWILLFVIQSTLVAVLYASLQTPGRLVLLVANALAFVWSTTVMCEMLHASYMHVKSDEQELHDLMGGLR